MPLEMAFSLLSSFPICTFPRHTQCKRFSSFHRLNVSPALRCKATTEISGEVDVVRRSANYHAPIWDHDYIQMLQSDFRRGGSYKERASKLQGEVSEMLCGVVDPLEKLELIDTLQRLGLSRHFQDEINTTLKNISADCGSVPWKKHKLHATALGFRLLRQHGYSVSQEVFTSFMDEVGNIKASFSQDYKGLLNLYEASMLVEHALELPLHWRMSRLEASWFIDAYQKNKDKNPIVLQLAILDYNTVQAIHQDDLRSASAWWKDLGLCEKLSFARDRLMENFLWSVGMIITPQSGKSRRDQTKVNALITVIDDVYDVYGTLEELELFTDAVERWDINEIQRLPTYMKICYHSLYNSVNEMAFDILKEQGIDVLPFLKKVWTNLCKAYLLEAKWYYMGYIPTLQEYIDNAWLSISGSVMLGHAYLVTDHVTPEGLQHIEEYYHNIIYQSSIIVRLTDDLGTSSYEIKRGDVPKSIQCYMYENEASEEEAREHVKKLIEAAWRKINEEQMAESPFSRTFIEIAMDLARVSQLMYQNGDGHAIEDGDTKDRVLSLFVNPIPYPK
ncbi:hypothetical protein V6N12_054656 [Hibiscus sabdariffa]|uniref:(+)-delta-cadinene synthase n=1 Tax=Hibiscus sabdariffa TaxID=183260 RepID=A0ABR2D2V9_9ROSI